MLKPVVLTFLLGMVSCKAFAVNSTDSFVVTGQNFQQTSVGSLLVTPTGSTQKTLADALQSSGGAAPAGSVGDIQIKNSNTAFGAITTGTGVATALTNTLNGTGALVASNAPVFSGATTFSGSSVFSGSSATLGPTAGGAFSFISGDGGTNDLFFNFSTTAASLLRVYGTNGTSQTPIFDLNTSTASNARFYLPVLLSPNPVPGQYGFLMNDTWTGTSASPINFNVLQATDNTSSAGASVFNVNEIVNSTSAIGPKGGISGNFTLTGASGNTTGAGGEYVASQFTASANANDNGTALAGNQAKGSIFGSNIVTTLYSGATFWNAINPAEFDIVVQSGASVLDKIGLAVSQSSGDAVRGSRDDIGFVIEGGSTSPGWTTGISFGRYGGFPAITGTSTLIGAQGNQGGNVTAANGIDWHMVNFSGNTWNAGGITMTGAGVLTTTGAITAPLYNNLQDVQTFTTSGTWIKPAWCSNSGVTCISHGRMIGGGGGGGGGAQETLGTAGAGGAAGGGGACIDFAILTSGLGSTQIVAIGTSGAGGTGGTSGNGGNGGNGGITSMAGWIAYNGGGGGGGTTTASGGGSSGGLGGGGLSGSGATAGTASASTGVSAGASNGVGGVSVYGTGNTGGSGSGTTQGNAGNAAPCVGGAGSGGTLTTSSTGTAGMTGGASAAVMPSGGGTTGGGGGGTATGNGGLMPSTSGAGGGGANTAGNGGTGGSAGATAYGCGGGGGGSGTTAGGAGGAGCLGYVAVITTGN